MLKTLLYIFMLLDFCFVGVHKKKDFCFVANFLLGQN